MRNCNKVFFFLYDEKIEKLQIMPVMSDHVIFYGTPDFIWREKSEKTMKYSRLILL